MPFNYFDKDGQPVENITDWALNQFRAHYKNKEIGKRDIFYYVYGVLHNPAYRKKYAQNLKRQFPRIPFYDDFGQWRNWGKRLMELHVGYETANPFGLKRIERKGKKMNTPSPLREPPPCQGESSPGHQLPRADRANEAPKPRLKADKEKGLIEIDAVTSLTGVPKDAWGYMLGNRSAIEWVLEQYKETKLKDPTLRERFDTYRLVDYKDDVIALVQKVVTVSVETMKIVDKMKQS